MTDIMGGAWWSAGDADNLISKKTVINAVTKQICFKDQIKWKANYNTEVKMQACTNTRNHKYK